VGIWLLNFDAVGTRSRCFLIVKKRRHFPIDASPAVHSLEKALFPMVLSISEDILSLAKHVLYLDE
jgi:hypothetical protein